MWSDSLKTFLDGRVTLHGGDCLEVVRGLPDNSIDSVVTDPPYALVSITKRFGKENAADVEANFVARKTAGQAVSPYARAARGFMGKQWDTGETAFAVEFWAEVLRVLKPGAHIAAFGGTRSYHRLACAIEDAGFEIRDQLAWVYGTGFPKSHDVSKGIDKAAGVERTEAIGKSARHGGGIVGNGTSYEVSPDVPTIYAPATDAARQWEGWGTALKPSYEPILFGSKPLKVEQHIAILVQELTLVFIEAARWSNCNANDVESRFPAILAKCEEASISVLDGARMRSLESIGIAKSAARSSISHALASIDLIRTKDCSALSHVARFGSAEEIPDQTTEAGTVVDILTRLMAMSTSVMLDGMSESIASSWLDISDALLAAESKFTIATASRLTIALRTLNCSMLPIISVDTGRLTPNWEPICLARKPLSEKTVAANVLRWGTGAINVDGCRVEGGERQTLTGGMGRKANPVYGAFENTTTESLTTTLGRFPANLCHDGSDEVLAAFPESKGGAFPAVQRSHDATSFSVAAGKIAPARNMGDSGSAARFYYSAKASKADRALSKHPTVKPVKLMQWLCRLITPPKTFAFRCVVCDKADHEAKNLQSMPQPVHESTLNSKILLSGMSSEELYSAESELRSVREANPSSASGVLLDGMSSTWIQEAENATTSAVRELRGDIPAKEGRSSEILHESVRGEAERNPKKEAEQPDYSRLSTSVSSWSRDGDQDGVHIGTSLSDVGTFGKEPRGIGSSPSHQRSEGRQPNRKFGTDDQRSARQDAEAEGKDDNLLPSLQRQNKTERKCQTCGGCLTLVENLGVTLDPFAGTGTTGEAAWREGFSTVLIEREEEYQADIERRMLFARAKEKPAAGPPKPRKRDCDPGTLELPFVEFDSDVAYQTTMAAE